MSPLGGESSVNVTLVELVNGRGRGL
jgi:hypothetical protein